MGSTSFKEKKGKKRKN